MPEDLCKYSYRNGTFDGNIGAVTFDVFDFAQGFCRQITFAAMRAGNDGNIFDDEKIFAFAVAFGNVNYSRAVFAANIADHFISFRVHNFPNKSL